MEWLTVLLAAGGAYSSYMGQQGDADSESAAYELNAYNSGMSAELALYNAAVTQAVAEYNAQYAVESANLEAYMTLVEGAYDAEIARNNAKIATTNSINVRAAAEYEATLIRSDLKRALGAQRAQFGSSGVQLSGSARDVQYDSALQGELDAKAAQYSGAVEGAAFDYLAALYEWQAEVVTGMSQAQAAITQWSGQATAEGLLLEAGYAAEGYAMQAEQYSVNAAAYSEMAEAARSGSDWSTWATIIGGAADVYSAWPTMNGSAPQGSSSIPSTAKYGTSGLDSGSMPKFPASTYEGLRIGG